MRIFASLFFRETDLWFSSFVLFIWFCFWNDTGFVKLIWKCFFPLYFVQQTKEYWYYGFISIKLVYILFLSLCTCCLTWLPLPTWRVAGEEMRIWMSCLLARFQQQKCQFIFFYLMNVRVPLSTHTYFQLASRVFLCSSSRLFCF